MINLNKKLQTNKHYTNYGSVFSRLLLLKDVFKKTDSFLVIVENEKTLQNYLKTAAYLWIEINSLDNFSDLINYCYNKNWKYIVTKNIFNIKLEDFVQLEYNSLFKIEVWQKKEVQDLTKKINEHGYSFSDYENKNTYKIMWDVLSFTDSVWNTTKISFWWDDIEEIINSEWEKREEFFIGKNDDLDFLNITKKKSSEIREKIIETGSLIILDSLDFYSTYEFVEKYLNNYIIFNSLSNDKEYINLWINDMFLEKIEDFKNILEEKWIKKYIFTKNKQTIKNFLKLNNLEQVKIYETSLNILKSFKTTSPQPSPLEERGQEKKMQLPSPPREREFKGEVIICDDNISRIFVKKRIKRSLSKNLDLMMQIKPWDFIVHIDHGIWVFKEIIEKDLGWIKKEYITLEYKKNDKLFVPITEVSRVSKYVWVENPKLTWLSTKEWQKKLKKVSEDVEIIAKELLEVYAKRKLNKWFKFLSIPTEEVKFANSFEYTYTNDQFNIIKDIYKDMESENPMDRLLSGDVGFGKTEIAFAAIFKAVINGKQAALISPLVVLAYEHYEKAVGRFHDFPVNVWVITRFEKASVIKATLERLKTWKIDIIIWTHRLLSEDIRFKDLWLLVIDEEHKFGVKDKEKIKKFKGNIDILSMSATPIPRSLNMALNGIKSISMLTTPPIWRLPINTMVSSFDDKTIFDAGKREFERSGQMFFIHNRVETIDAMGNYLSNIFPWKKVIIVHGQLSGDRLEKRIIKFKRKQGDILLATTVVENWIDFSNVNTIFINEAQNFWISQIHQLRWRVWRSDKKGYCYLLFKKDKIKEDAAKRLKTIVDYSHLWAWFELAIKDLEVRGWWDILWIRQSGQGNEVWAKLFLEMLENRVEELKKTPPSIPPLPGEGSNRFKKISIDLNIGAYIDEKFFSWELDKLNFYREIESLETLEDLENIIYDFKVINKNLPDTTNNFFDLLKLKLKAKKYKIISIKKVWINYQIDFDESLNLEELKEFLKLDKEVKFIVVSKNRLRTSIKNFASTNFFLQYMLQLFDLKLGRKKIKLKRRWI